MNKKYKLVKTTAFILALAIPQFFSANALAPSNNRKEKIGISKTAIVSDLNYYMYNDYLNNFIENTKDQFPKYSGQVNYQLITGEGKNNLVIYYENYATVIDVNKITKPNDGKNIEIETTDGLIMLIPSMFLKEIDTLNPIGKVIESTIGPDAVIQEAIIVQTFSNYYGDIRKSGKGYNAVVTYQQNSDEVGVDINYIYDIVSEKDGEYTLLVQNDGHAITPMNLRMITVSAKDSIFIYDLNTLCSINQLFQNTVPNYWKRCSR